MFFAFQVSAQECRDYRDYVHGLDVAGEEIVDLAVAGDYAFGACGVNGLTVFDVSNPRDIEQVGGFVADWTDFDAVAVAGDYVYLVNDRDHPASSDSSLIVMDVSDPASPFIADAIATSSYAYDIVIAGGFAYVTVEYAPQRGVHAYDLSTPGTMVHRGYLGIVGRSRSLAAGDGALAVTMADDEVRLVDISTPDSPVAAGSISISGLYDWSRSFFIGDTLYVRDLTDFPWDIVYAYDVSDPYAPSKTGETEAFQDVYCIADGGAYAYVGHNGGIGAVDMSDPSNPVVICFVKTSAHPIEISTTASSVLVAGGSLETLDLDPAVSAPRYGTLDSYWIANDIALQGDYAYIADLNWNLQVVDITDPMNPTHVRDRDTVGQARALDISGNHVYVADKTGGLDIFDLTDPTRPQFVTNLPFADAEDVKVDGVHAYVADGHGWLKVADVTDPAVPTEAGYVRALGNAHGIDVVGDHAYLATDYGLEVFDVSTPLAPVPTGSVAIPSGAVVVDGAFAYVLDTHLSVIDVSDPTAPALMGSSRTGFYGLGLAVDGERQTVYAAVGNNSIVIVDVSSPAAPRVVGNLNTDAEARGVALAGDLIYIAQAGAGMFVASGHCPVPSAVGDDIPLPTPGYLRAYPNPFNPQVTIEYVALPGSSAELALYDLRGRLVRNLPLDPGLSSVVWNGHDDAGRTLPSGTYLVRMKGESSGATGRITLLR